MKLRKPAPLHRRLVWWLLGYLAMISVAVFSVGNYVHEHAEHSAWRALLNSELDSIVSHIEHEPHYRWQDSDTLRLFTVDDSPDLPPVLRSLHPGLHDGVQIAGRSSAVMVRDTKGQGRLALALDINDFHELEEFATRWVMLASVVMIVVTVVMASFGVSRLVSPLRSLARHIDGLKPGVPGQRVEVDPRGSSELYVIAAALNDYLARNEQFVERERVFISTASHELRTPIAVIQGAVEVLKDDPEASEGQRTRLDRIDRGILELSNLLEALLLSARGRPEHDDEIDLAALCRGALARLQSALPSAPQRLLIVGTGPTGLMAPQRWVACIVAVLFQRLLAQSAGSLHECRLDAEGFVLCPRSDAAAGEGAPLQGDLGLGLMFAERLCRGLGWQLEQQLTPAGLQLSLRIPRPPAA